MTRKEAIKWHKKLVREGYFRLARALLSALRGGGGELVIRDLDSEAYDSGLADYLLSGGKYINRAPPPPPWLINEPGRGRGGQRIFCVHTNQLRITMTELYLTTQQTWSYIHQQLDFPKSRLATPRLRGVARQSASNL